MFVSCGIARTPAPALIQKLLHAVRSNSPVDAIVKFFGPIKRTLSFPGVAFRSGRVYYTHTGLVGPEQEPFDVSSLSSPNPGRTAQQHSVF